MGDSFAFNSANDIVSDKWKGDKMLRKSLAASGCGGMGRKGLTDITNSQQKTKLSNGVDKSRLVPVSTMAQDLNDQLFKENQALMKQIAERNKIIELSGIELQKLRINLHKAQQQNWHLAQANSQMLAELNAGKDKLKSLQHELGCMKGILAVRNLEVQEKKVRVECQPEHKDTSEILTIKSEEGSESTQAEKNDSKRSGNGGRRHSKAHVNDNKVKERAESKRLCVRRQSTRFKPEEPKPIEDLFEIDEAKFPVCPQPIIDNKVVRGERNAAAGPGETRRTSLGRPLRTAAVKVQTYKEVPLNVKMRRPT